MNPVSLFFKNVFGGIPWQAWVSAVVAAVLLFLGWVWHREVLSHELDNLRHSYEMKLKDAKADLDRVTQQKNDLIQATDNKLLGSLDKSEKEASEAFQAALEKIRANRLDPNAAGDESTPECRRCFRNIDSLRFTTGVRK